MFSDAIYLLVPLFLPAAGAVLLPALPRFMRQRFLSAVLLLEVIFSILAGGLRGTVALFTIGSAAFVLTGEVLAAIFSVLFSVMFCLAGFFGYEYLESHHRTSYYVFFLLTLAAMQGVCYAGTALTFYMFYELMTLFSFPLVLHERTKEALRAAGVYLGYSLFGAALALFGFFVLSGRTQDLAFRPGGLPALAGAAQDPLLLAAAFAMLVGFAAKAGMMPLHAWLPIAHPEAPAPASAVLSGCITKAGILGIIRVCFYLYGANALRGTWVQLTMLVLALVTVFSGSMLAYKENLLKRRLAWSTVSQASYVIFGLLLFTPAAFTGALLQAVFHAVAKVTLFLCAGAIICKTGKTRVDQLTGIGRQMPLTLFCFALAGLSLVGIPPFAGFVSKWYLAQGALDAFSWGWVGAAILLVSALLTAGYLLVPVARGFFPGRDYEPDAKVYSGLFIAVPLTLLAGAALWLGLFPAGLLRLAQVAAATLL